MFQAVLLRKPAPGTTLMVVEAMFGGPIKNVCRGTAP